MMYLDGDKLVYDAIVNYIQTVGYAPNIRELCERTGIRSSSTLWKYLKRLEKQGMIRLGEKNEARTIAVVGYHFCKR